LFLSSAAGPSISLKRPFFLIVGCPLLWSPLSLLYISDTPPLRLILLFFVRLSLPASLYFVMDRNVTPLIPSHVNLQPFLGLCDPVDVFLRVVFVFYPAGFCTLYFSFFFSVWACRSGLCTLCFLAGSFAFPIGSFSCVPPTQVRQMRLLLGHLP